MLWEVCLQDLFHISRNRREKEEGKTEAVAALLDHNTVKVMIKRNKERESDRATGSVSERKSNRERGKEGECERERGR